MMIISNKKLKPLFNERELQYFTNMSKRILTTDEITAVGAILKDKQAIQLLKEIRDNVITEGEDTKGKRKNNEIFNFIGFSSGEDLLGEDSESEEYQNKKAAIRKLADIGLVIEGFHIPLERKSEKKFGDVRISDVDNKISKYQLTDEGYAVLSVVDEEKSGNGGNRSNSSNNKQQQQEEKGKGETKEVKAFKKSQEQEQKQQEQQKSKEIEDFKAAQRKELGQK